MIQYFSDIFSNIPIDGLEWIAATSFIAIDVILGTLTAILQKNLSSQVARQGIMHKLGFVGALTLCTIIDIFQTTIDLGYTVPTLSACTLMIIACETISICEHISALNPEINISFLKEKK